MSSVRICWCALLLPKSTPSGTITAARPPNFSPFRISAKNNNSVFLLSTTANILPSTASRSRLPLNGGLANTKVAFSVKLLLASLRASTSNNCGFSMPCNIRFMPPIRIMVGSNSMPINIFSWKCFFTESV